MFRYLALIIILFTLLGLGCAPEPVPQKPEPAEKHLFEQADQYWQNQDFEAAEVLYRQLASREDMRQRQRILILSRLARASFFQENYAQAVRDLLSWAQADPRARQNLSWHEMYGQALQMSSGEQEFAGWLASILEKPDLPQEVRSWAALRLAFLNFDQNRPEKAMEVLYKAFAALDPANRVHLQQEFEKYLQSLSLDQLEQAASALDHKRMLFFPQSIFYWTLYSEQLRQHPGQWDILQPKMNRLIHEGEFALQDHIQEDFQQWTNRFGKPLQKIAVLLPLSGTFSSAGWKILRGAELAHWELIQRHNNLKVTFINTNQDNWLEKLQEEGPFSVAAGPVSSKNWEKITSAGLNRDCPFFAFLPDIEQEGTSGWRFFPSSRDQVQSMLDLTVNELGLTNYAIFYPLEEYGRSHASSFWEQAAGLNALISGLKEYSPDQPTTWNQAVKSFLKVQKDPETERYSSPAFEAIFIPDSLSRAKALIPQFFYFDQSQLLFMGPMLWSEGFTSEGIEKQYFSLAIAPGPWWGENPEPAVLELKKGLEQTLQGEPDFWVALGYDFVRFAAALDITPGRVKPEQINDKLSSADFSSWTMAPIEWNSHGQASQDLFVFSMSSEGLSRVDPHALGSLLQFRKDRKRSWLEQLPQEEQPADP